MCVYVYVCVLVHAFGKNFEMFHPSLFSIKRIVNEPAKMYHLFSLSSYIHTMTLSFSHLNTYEMLLLLCVRPSVPKQL